MVKNMPANAGDSGSIPESGRYPGKENGNPLQYSCLKSSVDMGYSPWSCKELDMTEHTAHTRQEKKVGSDCGEPS